MDFHFEEEKKNYSINEVAEIVGVVPQTLRQWEKTFQDYIKVPRNESNQRYYTKDLVELFSKIKQLKDSGATSMVINKMLAKSDGVEEIKEQSLELVTVNQLTGYEFKQIMMKQFGEMLIEREEQMKREYESKLEMAISKLEQNYNSKIEQSKEQILEENKQLKEVLNKSNAEMKLELHKQESQIREQIQSENDKLIKYIAATREEDSNKGFWQRLFGK